MSEQKWEKDKHDADAEQSAFNAQFPSAVTRRDAPADQSDMREAWAKARELLVKQLSESVPSVRDIHEAIALLDEALSREPVVPAAGLPNGLMSCANTPTKGLPPCECKTKCAFDGMAVAVPAAGDAGLTPRQWEVMALAEKALEEMRDRDWFGVTSEIVQEFYELQSNIRSHKS